MNDQQYDMSLRNYVDTAIKRKNTILAVFVISVALTAVAGLLSPKIYEVSMIIEPGAVSAMGG